MFVVGTDLFVISPLLPAISAEFGLSAAAAGLNVTVFSVIYLFSAPVIGHLADRIGRRRVLLTCLLGFAVANAMTGLASGFVGLLIARFFAGITTAGVSPLIYAGVGEAAPPDRRATWMGIAVSGLLLALSVGAPLGTIVASHWGWRAPFFVLAGGSVILIVVNRLVWPIGTRGVSGNVGVLPAFPLPTVALRLLPTVLWATGLYAAYTYLGVWLTGAGLSPAEVARAIGFYGGWRAGRNVARRAVGGPVRDQSHQDHKSDGADGLLGRPGGRSGHRVGGSAGAPDTVGVRPVVFPGAAGRSGAGLPGTQGADIGLE